MARLSTLERKIRTCDPYMSFSVWLRSHALVPSLVVLFFSVSLRVFIISREDPNELVVYYPDAPTYLGPATSLIEARAFLNHHGTPEIRRTPGYPLFIAGIMELTGSDLRRVLLAQTVILSFGPLIVYALARRSLPPIPAFIGGLIAACSPWGAILAAIPLSDGLFLLLLTIVFLLMKATKDLVGTKALLGAASIGLVTGMAVLVRPVWPIGILVPGAFLFYVGFRRKGVRLLLLIILVFALAPAGLWRERNKREAGFHGISDISGGDAWQYLAARVRAELTGQDRFLMVIQAEQEEENWGLPTSGQEIDNERWKQATAIFKAHPFVTAYSFSRSALEHAIHPSPDVLTSARLHFRGDTAALAGLWAALLLSAAYGLWALESNSDAVPDEIDRRLLVAMLVVCLAVTFSSGITFSAGSRLRAPMEAIVPLLAALGLVRVVHRARGLETP